MLKLLIAVFITLLSTTAMASKHEKYVDMLINDGEIKAQDRAKTLCKMDALEAAVYALDKEVKKIKDLNNIKPLNPYEIIAQCDKKHN
jgi:hypothetical protein